MRSAARILVILCALGSIGFTLLAGQHNRSVLLVSMFAVWVALPFVGYLSVLRIAERRPTRAPRVLHPLAIILSVISLALYAVFALHPPQHQAAAPFLLLPVVSWVTIGAMWFYARQRE